jgi:ribosome-binding protein aMBF1 (putative translation factor)
VEDSDRFRCQICGQVPEKPHHYNPFLCTNCGMLVCDQCYNEQKHVHPKSAEELFREAHTPKKPEPKQPKTYHQSTTGIVDDDDVPF